MVPGTLGRWLRTAAPILLLALPVASCGLFGSEEKDSVRLRIRNVSDVEFSSVVVSFPGASAEYGLVPAGQESPYVEPGLAYRYGHVEVTAGAERYELRPIDYVGETPLPPGLYTYEIDVDGEDIFFEFRVDG